MGLSQSGSAQSNAASNPAVTSFRALADQYFDEVYFKYAPTTGTLAGFHQYDVMLEDYSRAAVDGQIAALHVYDKKFAAISIHGT